MYEQLMKVSRGFRLVYIGLVLFVVAFLGGVVGVFLLAAVFAKGGKDPGTLATVIAVAMLLCVLGASITGLVGRFFCLAVPAKAGSAKALIITSVALEGTAMALGSLNQLRNVGVMKVGPAATEIFQTGWVLLSVASAITFLLFTKAAARFIRERELAEKAASILWLWASMFGCYVLGTVLTLAVVGTGGASGGAAGAMCFVLILLIAAFVLAVKALFRYVGLTREMSEAIEDYARSVRRAQRNKRKRERKQREVEAEDEDEDEEE